MVNIETAQHSSHRAEYKHGATSARLQSNTFHFLPHFLTLLQPLTSPPQHFSFSGSFPCFSFFPPGTLFSCERPTQLFIAVLMHNSKLIQAPRLTHLHIPVAKYTQGSAAKIYSAVSRGSDLWYLAPVLGYHTKKSICTRDRIWSWCITHVLGSYEKSRPAAFLH